MIVFKVRKKERRIAERRTPRVTDYPLTNKERRGAPNNERGTKMKTYEIRCYIESQSTSVFVFADCARDALNTATTFPGVENATVCIPAPINKSGIKDRQRRIRKAYSHCTV